jgi:CDP-glucose 4,6-dehydratase
MMQSYSSIFKGMRVLVTGHTGFKGSWLSIWLKELGAEVVGYSLPPVTDPNHFQITSLSNKLKHIVGDVRDYLSLKAVLLAEKPEIVFHLAAQPIVLHSFKNPKETFEVNAGGTINLLEAARGCRSIRAMVMVTSDKCYENKEWLWGYRENDALCCSYGSSDPYSASKAMAELAIASYRSSFFEELPFIASVRAGNVIGGGDFSEFRLLPDCMKCLINGVPVSVRNPASTRPWLHVLDPLDGYLRLAVNLLQHGSLFAESWNFGPKESEGVTVQQMIEKAIELWGKGEWCQKERDGKAHREMGLLRLNWDKASHRLKWVPQYSWSESLKATVYWFKAYEQYCQQPDEVDMYQFAVNQIKDYSDRKEDSLC